MSTCEKKLKQFSAVPNMSTRTKNRTLVQTEFEYNIIKNINMYPLNPFHVYVRSTISKDFRSYITNIHDGNKHQPTILFKFSAKC